MDAMDVDDEVVKEIDVYMNQDASNKFYIFQYPLKPPWRQNNFQLLEEIRMRPSIQKVEMDFTLDVHGEHYNEYKKDKPNKTTLTSSSVQHRTNYAIGLFRDDALHLAPLHSILQFRPSFEYITDSRKKEKMEEEKGGEDEVVAMMEDDDGDYKKSRPISMQYKRRENPRFRPQAKKIEDEPWTKLQFLDASAAENEDIYNKLLSAPHVPIQASTSAAKYLDEICPPSVPPVSHTTEASQAVSIELINKLPIDGQVRFIMLIGNILTFKKIEELATSSPSRQELLKHLERYALMVRGVWTVKSEECCTGPAIIARDYMLYKFYKNGKVNRKKFATKTGLSDSVAREMLLKVADVLPARDWELRYPPDEDFIAAYPEYDARYKQYWLEQAATIKTRLADSKNIHKTKTPSTSTSTSTPLASGTPARTMPSPYSGTPAATMTSPSSSSSSSSSLAQASRPSVGVRVTPGMPFGISGDPTLYDEMRKFLVDTFKIHPVCSPMYLRSKFTTMTNQKYNNPENNNIKPPSWASDGTIIDEALRAVLPEVAQKIGRVYALKSVGDPEIDKYRAVIMQAYDTQNSFKKNELQQLCKKALGEEIKANTYIKIIHELAQLHQGRWVIKTGEGS